MKVEKYKYYQVATLNMSKVLDDIQELQVCRTYLYGNSMTQIAEFFGVNRSNISRILHQHSVVIRSPKALTEIQELNLCKAYLEGEGPGPLSKRYKINYKTVYYVLRRHHVEFHRPRRHVDEHFFKDVNTPVKSYWIGFLVADGYIFNHTELSLGLGGVDEKHLCKFRDVLHTDYAIKLYAVGKYTKACLRISNRVFVNQLEKVFNRDKVMRLPKSLLNHFVRGVFDGDGSVSIYKPSTRYNLHLAVSLLGKKTFLLDLLALLPSKKSPKLQSCSCPEAAVYAMTFYSHTALELLNWLYKDSTEDTRLARKYDRYLQALGMVRDGKLSGFS